MEARGEPSLAVLRLFGREPLVEDWRCVGRWSYAAAWLAEDWTTARQIVRARLTGAAAIATTAAMGAGRGDADRFTLVSAIARFREAFEEGDGPLGAAAERMVDDGASRLLAENEALRSATSRERAAFAPRFGLEGFAVAMLDSGSERHVLLREAAQSLDEALLTARGACPSLRTLRMFLHATLALDSQEATVGLEVLPTASKGDLVAQLSLWLNADLALLARRASAYEAAWAAAARAGGDALSRTIAGLASGAMLSRGAVDAIRGEPAALLLSLAMTYTPEHASALLDCGTQAQTLLRAEARQEVAKWAVQAQRVDDLEERVGVSILASFDAREGYREAENCGGLDLFSAWNVHQTATEARGSLREAAEKSIAAETLRRREAVRKAKALLEKARLVYEAAIEEARSRLDMESRPPPNDAHAEENAQRGCVFGFGAGCSVMATYVVVGFVIGTGGVVGRIAPLVVAVAALPVAAAILAQLALAARRAAAAAEANRKRAAAAAEFERLRSAAERAHGSVLAEVRETLDAAEARLAELEHKLRQSAPQAA